VNRTLKRTSEVAGRHRDRTEETGPN